VYITFEGDLKMSNLTTNTWALRLASKFIHDPKEYVFVGCQSGFSCACGHDIKTAYVVSHPSGHTLELGSSCIETYTELGSIKEQVDAYVAKTKADAKAAKAAAIMAEFEDALDKLKTLRSLVVDAMKRGHVTRPLWSACYSGSPWNKLKSPAGKLRKVNEAYAMLLANVRDNNSYPGYSIVNVELSSEQKAS
jgi:hypothetical protein